MHDNLKTSLKQLELIIVELYKTREFSVIQKLEEAKKELERKINES